MPYYVNGQFVAEWLIREESVRLSRDPQWNTIQDAAERARRLRAAAEHSAQDRILIEQAAAADPRPVDAISLEQEVAQQNAYLGRRTLSEEEVRDFAKHILRVRRIREEMVADFVKPTAEELEAFFNANRERFPQPEMFHASHIVKYVNEQQSEERAEAGIEAALAELERGVPFAEVAGRHSDCKENGGDLGRFPAGRMVPEFEEAIRALEPGQRSGIFTTPFGFHIALLHSREEARTASFADVRDGIERVFKFVRQHEAYLRAIGQMRSSAEIRWAPEAEPVGAVGRQPSAV